MNGAEVIAAVEQFLSVTQEAATAHHIAIEVETENNDATQDILHIAELAPETFNPLALIEKLHELRANRRRAKQEVQILAVFAEWCDKNKKSMDFLKQSLGVMRRYAVEQDHSYYRLKTSVLGEKGAIIAHVDHDENQLPGQLTIEEVMKIGN